MCGGVWWFGVWSPRALGFRDHAPKVVFSALPRDPCMDMLKLYYRRKRCVQQRINQCTPTLKPPNPKPHKLKTPAVVKDANDVLMYIDIYIYIHISLSLSLPFSSLSLSLSLFNFPPNPLRRLLNPKHPTSSPRDPLSWILNPKLRIQNPSSRPETLSSKHEARSSILT